MSTPDQRRQSMPRELARVFGLLALLFSIRWLPEVTGFRAFIAEDFPVLNLPVRAWLGDALRQGILPFWTPLLQGGYPLFAESQAGATYPLRVLHALPVAPWTVLSWTIVLHLAWAGTGLYGYLRGLGLRTRAAFLPALVFAGSTTLLARHQHTNVLEAVCWWPWLLYAADHAVRSNRARSWLALGAATGLMACCGHAQFVVYGATLAGGYALLKLGLQPAGQRLDRLPGMLLAGVVGVGLAAPQYLPLWELRGHSLRAAGVWEAGEQSFKPAHWPLLLAPGFWGPLFDASFDRPAQRWEVMAYLGMLPPLLAVIGIRQRDPVVRFWLLVAVVALLGAGGERFGVFRLLEFLPGWSAFRAPARLLTVFALALAILAGFGAERVAAGDWQWNRKWWGLTRVFIAGLVLGVIVIPPLMMRYQPVAGGPSLLAISTLGMFGLLSLGWLHLVGDPGDGERWFRQARRALGWKKTPLMAAIGLVGIDIALAGMPLTPTVPASFYRDRPPVPEGRIAVGPGRDPKLFWYQPDTNLLLGAANLHNMSPLALANQVRLLEAGLAKGTLDDLYTALGVTWLPAKGSGVPLVESGWPYHGDHALPVFAWRSGTVAEATEAVATDPLGDWDQLIVTGCEALPGKRRVAYLSPYDRVTPNRVVWSDDVGTGIGGWLLDQTPYPGWRAWIGQQPAPVCMADVVNTLVVDGGVRHGESHIRLVFDPVTIRLGRFLGLLAVALGVMILCAGGSGRDE